MSFDELGMKGVDTGFGAATVFASAVGFGAGAG